MTCDQVTYDFGILQPFYKMTATDKLQTGPHFMDICLCSIFFAILPLISHLLVRKILLWVTMDKSCPKGSRIAHKYHPQDIHNGGHSLRNCTFYRLTKQYTRIFLHKVYHRCAASSNNLGEQRLSIGNSTY